MKKIFYLIILLLTISSTISSCTRKYDDTINQFGDQIDFYEVEDSTFKIYIGESFDAVTHVVFLPLKILHEHPEIKDVHVYSKRRVYYPTTDNIQRFLYLNDS